MNSTIDIIIIEDEIIIAMMLQEELRRIGYTVKEIFTTGEKAISYIRENPSSLLLVDVNLAGRLDGIQTIENIRDFAKIPVIFITGFSNEEVVHRINELHPEGFFVKPVNIQELKLKIESIENKSERGSTGSR